MDLNTYQSALVSLDRLADDDLFAMIGTDPQFASGIDGDHLFVRLNFDRTRESINEGRKRLAEHFEHIRNDVCATWVTMKSLTRVYERAEILATVCEIIMKLRELDPFFPVVPAGILICRGCGYSLNALCGTEA